MRTPPSMDAALGRERGRRVGCYSGFGYLIHRAKKNGGIDETWTGRAKKVHSGERSVAAIGFINIGFNERDSIHVNAMCNSFGGEKLFFPSRTATIQYTANRVTRE